MDTHHGLHRRFQVRRQGLAGAVGGLLGDGNSPTPSSVSTGTAGSADPQNPENNPLGLGGIVGGLTSLVGGVPTILAPPSGSSSATPSSTPLTHSSSSSSTGSTTTSSTSTTASSSSTTSTSTTIHSSTPTLTPTPSPSDTVYSMTSGTSIVYITKTASEPSATAAPPKSFLQNPPLEGGVFALVGIAVLIIIFTAVTCTLRKRRRDRLDKEIAAAVTFDPTMTDRYEDDRMNSIEKHRLSGSSYGHGFGNGDGFGYGAQPAYAPQLAPQQGYYGQADYGQAAYGQYPVAAYRTPSPNPAPHRAPSPTAPQAGAYGYNPGGANLTRKYSDRKPVPPLLPAPVYDPSHAQVAPQQYYHHGQEQPLPPVPMRSVSPALPAPGGSAAPVLPATFGEPNPEVLKVANQ
ncbi:hypothetical protein HYDPIDRAFT_23367 [Hydnomerulius pinastri MD-312]|nr:hypothetical protein HYDPIDRAFT_23367 [Hydnomerulius pinastri MD-312]